MLFKNNINLDFLIVIVAFPVSMVECCHLSRLSGRQVRQKGILSHADGHSRAPATADRHGQNPVGPRRDAVWFSARAPPETASTVSRGERDTLLRTTWRRIKPFYGADPHRLAVRKNCPVCCSHGNTDVQSAMRWFCCSLIVLCRSIAVCGTLTLLTRAGVWSETILPFFLKSSAMYAVFKNNYFRQSIFY